MDNALKFNVSSALLDLYCLYRQRWTCMIDPAHSPYPIQTIKHRFTDGDIINHLDGKYCVCVYAGEHATKFMTFDIDMDDPDVVHRLIDTLEDLGVPREHIYVSFSGRKGYHVDIFFKDFIYNSVAERLYWATIERGGFNPRKVEFRPTPRQAIKLPLGVHQVTRKRCWFVNPDTLQPIESFEYIYEIKRLDRDYVEQLVANIVNEHMRSVYAEIAKAEHTKPKTQTNGLTITCAGTRHQLQAKVAARARMDGNDYDDIVRIQMEWYRAQDQSLIGSSEAEVRADAEQLAAWAINNIIPNPAKPPGSNQAQPNQAQPITITKHDIPYILTAPTKAARQVLFLLVLFCKRYGEAQLSYETICRYTGLSEKTVADAIKWLADHEYIGREQTFYRRDKLCRMRGANKYTFPGKRKLYAPRKDQLINDQYQVADFANESILRSAYYGMLAGTCSLGYLEKYLTKPELEKVKEQIEWERK